jgi:hypothetical protein
VAVIAEMPGAATGGVEGAEWMMLWREGRERIYGQDMVLVKGGISQRRLAARRIWPVSGV